MVFKSAWIPAPPPLSAREFCWVSNSEAELSEVGLETGEREDVCERALWADLIRRW